MATVPSAAGEIEPREENDTPPRVATLFHHLREMVERGTPEEVTQAINQLLIQLAQARMAEPEHLASIEVARRGVPPQASSSSNPEE